MECSSKTSPGTGRGGVSGHAGSLHIHRGSHGEARDRAVDLEECGVLLPGAHPHQLQLCRRQHLTTIELARSRARGNRGLGHRHARPRRQADALGALVGHRNRSANPLHGARPGSKWISDQSSQQRHSRIRRGLSSTWKDPPLRVHRLCHEKTRQPVVLERSPRVPQGNS